MAIKLTIRELKPPQLQFGGAATTSDPKLGLDLAGPFDLRFGAARQTQVKVGIVGPRSLVEQTRRWLERCGRHHCDERRREHRCSGGRERHAVTFAEAIPGLCKDIPHDASRRRWLDRSFG